MRWAVAAAVRGLLPDGLIRAGIRNRLARQLRSLDPFDCEREIDDKLRYYQELRASPVAVATEDANEQHYELPPEFFRLVLGPHRKYSACWWPDGVDDLVTAEEQSLRLTCRRADVRDGQRILELGCGWGSLSLWIAERYPRARVTAVSNSSPQGDSIRSVAARRGLGNLEVITADMNTFDPASRFDRVISLEMFEHMRNWDELYRRIAGWLEPDGQLFQHVFCHRRFAYPYVARDERDWMARYFFTGGTMPSDDQPYHFQRDLEVVAHWRMNGRHYARTLDAWLDTMDRNRKAIMPILGDAYGDNSIRWWHRWRLFFMACSELFQYRNGQEWWVSHYRLAPRADAMRGREAATPKATVVPLRAASGRERSG